MHKQPLKTSLLGVTLSTRETAAPEVAEAIWRKLRLISGLFILLTSLLLLTGHLTTRAIDPLTAPELRSLKEKLRLNPADTQMQQRIRQLDFQVRARYFRQLAHSASGVYLLLGGLALFLFASARCARSRRDLPMPSPRTPAADWANSAKLARRSVGAVGVIAATVALLVSLTYSRARIEPAGGQLQPAAAGAAAAPPVSEQEMAQNWPRFRGPSGGGLWQTGKLPANWDPKTGVGIAWKTPVPAPGFNSPIIWGNHFYFSGGDAAKREVFCYDCATGQPVWHQSLANVPGSTSTPAEIPETTGYAAPTMATDGRRVYVIFATGEIGAFTIDGKQVWSKSFGPLKNPYGYASSLLTWHDWLIVLLDQGESEDGKSKIYALDGATGQIAWQTPRKVGSSWASPISFEAAGVSQVVALSIPWAIGYRLTDGLELWRVECLSGEITPSPIFAGGMVLVPSPSDKLLAIRPDGRGEVTKTHIAWSTEENVPDITSPVSNGELVFTVTTPGVLTCFDIREGKKLWEHDFELEFHSSPSIAANRLYLFSQKGTAIVTEAGRQFKELFRTEMPDGFHASPAFTQDMIIVRGATNLWGLAERPLK